MDKKKIISAAMAMTVSLGTLFAGTSSSASTTAAAGPEVSAKQTLNHAGGPFDTAIANDEKLIEMLKENGTIAKNATPSEAQKALNKYLRKRQENALDRPVGELAEQKAEQHKKMKEKHDKKGLKKGKHTMKGSKKGHHKLDPVVEEEYSGDVRTDNVLVLLIDYPDYKHGTIKPEETDMFYENYSKEHYEKMIFGESGYSGPNGEQLISMKQFYEKQSGDSYTVEGKVAGWYTAEHPAAYYGANDPAPDGSDIRPRSLVKEALTKAGEDPDVELGNYDQEDRYDLDGDGNYREPDGIIDHLMIIHSGVGEEAGGGSLGADAVWSHRWNLQQPFSIPGTETDVPYWDGRMAGYDYTIEPEDGAAGVFAHEYGHDLGLPDEYDTIYSGAGEPIGYWSIMSSGSWAGKVPGTEPTGFSPYAKEYLQASMGGNWLTGSELNLEDLNEDGTTLLLDQANTKGTNDDAIHINLPDKKNVVNTPYSGKYEYFSGSGNNLDNSMIRSVDLTNAESAALTFKTWYQIEQNWDYASIQVKTSDSDEWVSIPGNLTTTEDPHDQNPGYGITGTSNGWVDATFDLSEFAGQTIQLKFNYWTDVAATMPGFYVDDIAVNVDGEQTVFDDAEGDSPAFSLEGFTKDEGFFFSEHFYLLEWRSHDGVDMGLAHIKRGDSLMSYEKGLVVWYVDNAYDNNWTGIHPGEGFLGVVDADQRELFWSDDSVASTSYQIHDAAFNLGRSKNMFIDYSDLRGVTLTDKRQKNISKFDSYQDYSSAPILDAGRNIPENGLEIEVITTSKDQSTAKINISRNVDTTNPKINTMINDKTLQGNVTVSDSETVQFTWEVEDGESGVAKVSAKFDDQRYKEGATVNLAGELGTHELTVTAVDDAGNEKEKSYVINVTTSSAAMKTLVNRFKAAGEFANDRAARTLHMHLVAVNRFEERGMADKVIKHLNGFKSLLNHQKENELISEKAYKILKTDTDYLIKKWQ